MRDPVLEYALMSYIVMGLGLTSSIFFLCNVKEVPLSKISAMKSLKMQEMLIDKKTSDKIITAAKFEEE